MNKNIALTNKKALKIHEYMKSNFDIDIIWATENGETNILGLTKKFGGCMIIINQEGQEDTISISLNGLADSCSMEIFALSKNFDFLYAPPYYESVESGIYLGDEAYKKRDEEIKKWREDVMNKTKSGLVDINGNKI